jgi:hypothetical protein
MTKFTNFMLLPMAVALATAAAACDTASTGDDDSDDTGGSGGSAGSGKGGSAGSGTVMGNTVLQPDGSGWMDKASTDWNDVEVQGAWYPYGDQYGAAKCTAIGMHPAADCSVITVPNPDPVVLEMTGYPQATPGRFCTEGDAAMVLDCPADWMTLCPTCSGCPMDDFSTMWGSGIGFDLNSEGGSQTAPKHPWNPDSYQVIGISFEMVDSAGAPLAPPPGGIRVEVPMQLNDMETGAVGLPSGETTDNHPDGAPFWDATSAWGPSPVEAGKNCMYWSKVNAPGTQRYMFDKTRMLGVQFHVPTNNMSRKPYSFCIQNVTMLRTPPTDCPANPKHQP